MEDSTMEDFNPFEDFQIEPIEEERLHEEPQKSRLDDVHSLDELRTEPIESPQEEAEKLMASQPTSDIEVQIEQMVPPKEEEQELIASQPTSDVELQIEPAVPLKEEAEKPTASQSTSDVDCQIDPIISVKEEIENLIASQTISNVDLQKVTLQEEAEKPIACRQTTDIDSQSIEKVDVTAAFTSNMVFDSRDELVRWVRDTGKTVGTVIVINKSDRSYSGRTPRISLGCERGGKYRVAKKGGIKPARRSGSKRCGCPFLLKGIKMPKDDQWKVSVACGFHNHPVTTDIEGHSYAGKLTSEEKEILVEMAKRGVKPKEALNVLKERNMHNVSKISTIYNARASMKLVELSRRSQMQQLLKKLVEHEYVEQHRSHEDGAVKDLFWAHPDSIKLGKCFPDVFHMDCTYKKNRFRPALLEIIGVTSTNKTFTFAFVYVEAEKEDNFVWALDCMKSVLNSEVLPSVIVTARKVTLMNAVKRVFPEARNLLCRYHISRDLATNCKKMFNTNEAWSTFMSNWNDLVFSSTEEEYYGRLSTFEGNFSEYPGAISYVKETWLSKYKDCFIAAWTDQSIHFGNTTTYKVDNEQQARLKRHLGSSEGNLNTMWSAISSLLVLQHTEINASFKESLNPMMLDYSTLLLFEELRGLVSIFALDLVLMEVKYADSIVPDDNVCDCVIRRTHGLPCVHEISRCMYDGSPIPLSCIHPHWKKLSSLPATCSLHDLDNQPEFQMLIRRIQEADENGKLELLKKVKELVMLF